MTFNTRVGASIARLREHAGLSVVELAELVGTDALYLASVEAGTIVPAPTFVSRVARALATQMREGPAES